ncbi:serine/threonine protein kinase [Verrucomicrobia bacterium]|nr:serine/threonine protein kinase [Verrucomicrobiota bacterium]MDB4664859.1 serine/threonine protein kinase [Verrucomicrobiota bacterium]MDG1889733.1 serine/threonine-protein kinase [Verrucomicrobiota bacterium]
MESLIDATSIRMMPQQRSIESHLSDAHRMDELPTLAESSSPGSNDSKSPATGMGHRQLMDNFQSIVGSQSIYYPVAYRFHERIGSGQQGVVFYAQRHGSRGCVTEHAVKVFDPAIYPNVKKYWADMGRIAAQVSRLQAARSPNLVDCDIYEETNGIGFVQMELIRGITLRQLLDGRIQEVVQSSCGAQEWETLRKIIFNSHQGQVCIQPGVAIYIMRQMLSGLETLHASNYLHCDIKPSNTMIDPLGYVKVIDFGRANFVNESSRILLGTPMFMAPEIHDRKPAAIQSDLYSVGLVGLFLMTGSFLSNRHDVTEQELKEMKWRLPGNLSRLLPSYVIRNEKFVEILQRLLSPDPARRYDDARKAESYGEGLAIVHKQLTQLNIDSEYRRDLACYIEKYHEATRGRSVHFS